VISRFSSHAPYECESTVDVRVQYVDSRVDASCDAVPYECRDAVVL